MEKVAAVFMELARCSSPSRGEALVAAYIKNYVAKYPELTVLEDRSGRKIGGNCGNLIVTIPGKAKHLLFDAHMDTVDPCQDVQPEIREGFIYSKGPTILGADDKSGIALMLVLIDALQASSAPHPTVTFLFSISEEQSLQGAKLVEQQVLQAVDFAYVLDGEGPIGTAIAQTPYGCKGTLTVVGKESHAGANPEAGVNAFVVAAEAVSQLTIGRIDPLSTCNIGVAKGGTATNVVMGKLDLQFEARSNQLARLREIITEVKQVFQTTCEKHGAQFFDTLKEGTPGYTLEDDRPILRYFHTACEKCGIDYQTASCGGGSNANVYRMRGIEAVNLSTNMQQIHSVDERIAIDDLCRMESLLKQLIQEHLE
ncbi:hypothetical protein NRIC_38220 [Enterococcus florum]|uniref:Peptidase M20 dimerisation domain-containing protein n=1 Tax=Enterococcus florum TaxID=2480627 RepID=A0A4P5PHN5_9ENTE|nr:M20/M25/M40 family metallo-hydrolase [Enterococcus florum]GCF95931.1 hypothetical protein NRIC_38220 [Enterococcus florum]